MMKCLVLLKERSNNDEETDLYWETFTKAGYKVEFVPILQHHLLNRAELTHELQSIRQCPYSGVVTTSQRAVEAFAGALADLEPSVKTIWQNDLYYFVVGTATGRALQQSARVSSACIMGAETSGSGERLSDFIVNYTKKHPDALSSPLLYLVGDKTRETISTKLQQHSIAVKEVQVYATAVRGDVPATLQAALECLPDTSPIWIACFSPSGVRAAGPLLKEHQLSRNQRFRCAAIGPTTQEALINNGFTVDAMADQPDPRALLDAITAASDT